MRHAFIRSSFTFSHVHRVWTQLCWSKETSWFATTPGCVTLVPSSSHFNEPSASSASTALTRASCTVGSGQRTGDRMGLPHLPRKGHAQFFLLFRGEFVHHGFVSSLLLLMISDI